MTEFVVPGHIYIYAVSEICFGFVTLIMPLFKTPGVQIWWQRMHFSFAYCLSAITACLIYSWQKSIFCCYKCFNGQLFTEIMLMQYFVKKTLTLLCLLLLQTLCSVSVLRTWVSQGRWSSMRGRSASITWPPGSSSTWLPLCLLISFTLSKSVWWVMHILKNMYQEWNLWEHVFKFIWNLLHLHDFAEKAAPHWICACRNLWTLTDPITCVFMKYFGDNA